VSGRVLIVGGGPAGLACAIALRLKGLCVEVLEGKTWPRDRVCGEGIMPTGWAVLERLGVTTYLGPEDCSEFAGIRYWDDDGRTARGPFPEGIGRGVRRQALSRALHRRATELGVILTDRALVKTVETLEDRIELSSSAGRHQGDVLILAAGRKTLLLDQLNLQPGRPFAGRRFGARQHFRCRRWSDDVEVWWSNGIEAYVTPSGENRVEIAFLWDQSNAPPELKSPEPFQGLIRRFPVLQERLQGQRPDSRFQGTGPLAWQAEGDWPDRVLLMGDTLGYGDGITGEGLSVSFEQALVLAEDLPPRMARSELDQAALQPLRTRLTQSFRDTLPTLRAALVLARWPLLRRFAIRALSRSPYLFSHFLAANMGVRPLWRFPVIGLCQAALGLIFPSPRQRKD